MADNIESEATNMKERIIKIMECERMGQAQFASAIGIQRAAMSHIISGRNNPSLDVMTKILHRYPQINPDWLLLGKGEMLRDNTPAMVPADNIAKNPPQIQVVPEGHQELPFQESRKELDNSEKTWAVSVEKPSKTVSKIMVFYSDNTYDTFVPEKQESE